MADPVNPTVSFIDAYIADVAAETGIAPSIIAAIISFIMQMISQCPAPPKPADILGGGGMLVTIAIYRGQRSVGIRPLSAEGQKLADSMQRRATKLSDTDAASFLAMSSVA